MKTQSLGTILGLYLVGEMLAQSGKREMLGGAWHDCYTITLPTYPEPNETFARITYWVTDQGRIRVGRNLDHSMALDSGTASDYIKRAKAFTN